MRRKIPSLQALACLDAAARHESYTRAAQELALTQGAVSRQITALEEFMGMALSELRLHTPSRRRTAAGAGTELQAMSRTLHLTVVPTFSTTNSRHTRSPGPNSTGRVRSFKPNIRNGIRPTRSHPPGQSHEYAANICPTTAR
ncbi:MAG: LysR family transcriptional regulator [Burkholderiales bacterium]|nr:LysR family transcriptional regulator [Burkholderiales bacterium]